MKLCDLYKSVIFVFVLANRVFAESDELMNVK